MEVAGADYYQEREKEEEVVDDVEQKVKQYHRKAQELQRIHKYNKAINYCQFSLNLMKGKPLNVSIILYNAFINNILCIYVY